MIEKHMVDWLELKKTVPSLAYSRILKLPHMNQCREISSQSIASRQGYILTNLINMSVKLFSTVSIVFFSRRFQICQTPFEILHI